MTPEIVRAIAKNEVSPLVPSLHTLTTTDDTPQVLAAIELDTYTVGILEMKLTAIRDDGTAGATTIKKVRWLKTGTLTLGTEEDDLPLEDDFAGITITIADVGENIEVGVTGIAATTIHWQAEIKTFSIRGTVLP